MWNESLRKKDWVIDTVSLDCCRRIVRECHYAKRGSNTATYRHGMLPAGSLWESNCKGIAWWIPPTKGAAAALVGEEWRSVLSLSRLAIMDEVPMNAASFLIRGSMKLIDRSKWKTLVTYADSWQGHTGAIYLAAGWTASGETKPERRYTLRGAMVSRKAGPRTRTHSEMMDLGCELAGSFSCRRFIHTVQPTSHRKE